jgi:hypothetical protein
LADIVARPWRFEQLGGEGRVLLLDGPNAPYGRPRRGPIVETERELRQAEVLYPGNDVPTRHIFGTRQNPIQLTGRFMDSRIGADGGARAKAEEVDQFVAGGVRVLATWGAILSLTGLLHRFKRSFESEAEIAWTLEMLVDLDETQPALVSTPREADTSAIWGDALAKLLTTQANLNPPSLPADIEYEPSFLDSLRNLISDINSFSASISSFVDNIDSLESTAFADVERFRGGIHQLATSVDQLQITLSTAQNDVGVEKAAAKSQVDWFQRRTDSDVMLLEVLAALQLLDLQSERAQKGTPDKTIRAQGGDTWESLAAANLGSASKADALRQANGVRYGTQPRAGQLVHVPKNA